MSAAEIKKLGPKKPLGEEVYEALKSAILKGGLKPGERLVEEQLAESLGASRTPVRQAIHKLEQDNLVQRLERGGFVVQGISIEDIAEILDLRCLLEAFAARQAAAKIIRRDLKKLERLNQAFLKAAEVGDIDQMTARNTEFHDTFYALSPNRRLARLIQEHRQHYYRYRVALLSRENMGLTSYRDHCDMLAAMAERNLELTEQLVRAHILKGKRIVLEEVAAGRVQLA